MCNNICIIMTKEFLRFYINITDTVIYKNENKKCHLRKKRRTMSVVCACLFKNIISKRSKRKGKERFVFCHIYLRRQFLRASTAFYTELHLARVRFQSTDSFYYG